MTAYAVTGMGLWAPGFPDLNAWRRGTPDDHVSVPQAALAPARARRATSHLTRMLVDVADQATRGAELDHASVATVFGSTHGEMQIAVEQMQTMSEGDGQLSPARFKNSVHNTAAGLFTLASRNHGFTTAIAAGDDTVAMSLLEAQALLEAGEPNVVVAVGEERVPEPLHAFAPHEELALGFALARSSHGGPTVDCVQRASDLEPPRVPPRFEAHPAAGALGLIDAILTGRPGRHALAPKAAGSGWCVTLEVSP